MFARQIAVHFGDKTWMRWISIQYGLFRPRRHGDAENPGVTKTCDAAFADHPQMALMSEVGLGPLLLGFLIGAWGSSASVVQNAIEPKSSASTSSATPARANPFLRAARLIAWRRRDAP